jgi:shikimate kinase
MISNKKSLKTSISLIGMAGAGKSSSGLALASKAGMNFVDSDQLIETQYKETLQSILDKYGYIKLRKIEESVLSNIDFHETILATGGSAIYSSKAMEYLRANSCIIFLDVPLELILKRVPSFLDRGFAKEPSQSIEDAFAERQELYKKYSHHTIQNTHDIKSCVTKIINLF